MFFNVEYSMFDLLEEIARIFELELDDDENLLEALQKETAEPITQLLLNENKPTLRR